MAKDIEDVKRRVDGLLRKAASTDNDHERDAFERKAMQLMVEWELTERDIRTEDPIKRHDIDTSEYGNFALGVSNLIMGIAKMNGGFPMYNTSAEGHRSRRGSRIMIYATDDCMERTNVLIYPLFRQMEYHFVVAKAESRKSFGVAWANTVVERLRAAQAIVYSESGALVPTNTAAEEKARANHRLVSANLGSINVSDEMHGRRMGEQADLMQDKVTR